MVQASVKIRPMEPGDISGILEIDRKISGIKRASTFSEGNWSLVNDWFHFVTGGQMSASFVAEVDGSLAGFVLAYIDYIREQASEVCVIQIFGVDPEQQKKGVAAKLFSRLLEECRSKKIKNVRISLEERDSEMKKFFVHLGFNHGRYIDYSKTL